MHLFNLFKTVVNLDKLIILSPFFYTMGIDAIDARLHLMCALHFTAVDIITPPPGAKQVTGSESESRGREAAPDWLLLHLFLLCHWL